MQEEELVRRIKKHPELRERFEEILDLTANQRGQAQTLDEAEEQAIQALRRLGQEVLQDWSQQRALELKAPYEQRKDLKKDGKKSFTGIRVLE